MSNSYPSRGAQKVNLSDYKKEAHNKYTPEMKDNIGKERVHQTTSNIINNDLLTIKNYVYRLD